MKILVFALVALLGLALLVGLVGPLWVESWILQSATARASEYLGVQVSIQDADLSLWQGRLQLTGVAVENPEGFSDRGFVKIQSVTASLALASLRSEQIRIESLVADTVELNIERGARGFNHQPILDRLKERSDSSSSSQDGDSPGRSFQIASTDIRNIRATASLSPAVPPFKLSIDDIHFDDISSEDGSAALKQVLDKIVASILGKGNFDSVMGVFQSFLGGNRSQD